MLPIHTAVHPRSPSRFRPPHCPWPCCPDHRVRRPSDYRHFVRNGSYTRKADPRPVPRFRCTTCGRGFSRQTFSVTYCMKRPELLQPVANWMVAGAALRRIARSHNGTGLHTPCHPTTVVRLARRIGSQCLLVLEESLRRLPAIHEPIVFDHFETFVGRQDNALAVLTPVGRHSWFLYGLEPAWHRRATARNRRRRLRPSPRAYHRSVERMLDLLATETLASTGLELLSDQHRAYPRAIASHPAAPRIVHRVYRNPPQRSRRRRTVTARDRAMSAVDLTHKWMRHVVADHRRETIAFARRAEAALERLGAFAVWRNFIQRRSERRNDRRTPAMLVGLASRPWTWAEVLARRRWMSRIDPGETTRQVLARSMRDPRGIAWPKHVRKRGL